MSRSAARSGGHRVVSRAFWAALTVGAVVGLTDAAAVETFVGGSRGVATWIFVPLTWITFSSSVWAVFSVRFLRRFLPGALIVTVPGLLLLSRFGPVIRRSTPLPLPIATLVLVIVALFAAAVFSRWLPAAHRFEVPAMAVAICGAALLTWHAWTPGIRSGERRVASDGRNLVLIFLDTVRYDDVGELTSLRDLDADAISFESAWSPSPWTLPSHFAVLTGENPWQVAFDPKSTSFSWSGLSLAQILSARGYVTGAIFANPLLQQSTGIPRGFQYLDVSQSCAFCSSGLMYLVTRLYFHAGRRSPVCDWLLASDVTHRAAEFVSRSSRPYFLALNYLDAHEPYYLEQECRVAGSRAHISNAEREELAAAFSGRTSMSVDGAERVYNQYRSTLRCLDRSLTALFQSLRRLPDYGNTVIAVVSDHGEQFGEHSLVLHGNSVYEQVLHVPLVLRVPGEKGRRITEPVSTADLYAILNRAVGVQAGGLGLLSSDRRPALSMYDATPGITLGITDPSMRSAFSCAGLQYRLLSWNDGREAVYDHMRDPREQMILNDFDRRAVEQLRRVVAHAWSTQVKGKSAFRSLPYLH
jgi:hypothetical protein